MPLFLFYWMEFYFYFLLFTFTKPVNREKTDFFYLHFAREEEKERKKCPNVLGDMKKNCCHIMMD